MRAAVQTPSIDTVEDLMAVATIWVRAIGKARELRLEVTSLGLICKLLERGTVQAIGRGTSADDAIADALIAMGLAS